MRVAVAAILPVAIAAGLGLWALVNDQWRAAESKSLEVTRLAASALDLEVERSFAILDALAASPALENGDLRSFQTLLDRVLAQMSGWHSIALMTPDGRRVVNAGAPASTGDSANEPTSFRRVVREQRPLVGFLTRGPDQSPYVPVRVPVIRKDRLVYVLTAELSPDAFLRVVESQKLPEDWVMSVFDGRGMRVARSRDHLRHLGTPGAPTLQELMAEPGDMGTGITRTLEGTEVYTAYVQMPMSGWSVAIGIPTATVMSGALRSGLLYGGGTLASLGLALVLAAMAAGGINRPIAALRVAAGRLGRGEVPDAPETPIQELADLGASIAAAARARRQVEDDRRAVLAQLVATRDDLRQQVADLERLHRLSHDLLQLPALEAQLETILAAACELQDSSRGLLSLVDADGRSLRLQASRGFSESARSRIAAVQTGAGVCGVALRQDRTVVIEDTETDPVFAPHRELARAEGFRSVHATPIRTGDGRVLGVLSVARPEPARPTERQQRLADLMTHLASIFLERAAAEAEAAASERRLAVALDSSTVPFSVLEPVRDGSGVIVDFTWRHVNRAGALLSGRPAEEMVGRRIGELMPEVWQMPGLFDTCVAVAINAKPVEYESATPDGKRWLHFLATPFEGRVAIWSADVTQRKQQEQALQAADRRKDEFLAVLAHELRNPLAPIQQAALISSAAGATEAQKRWSHEVIARQVRQMALLLEDLLDVSRITRGKLALRKSTIELRAAVEAAVETARPQVEGLDHRLSVRLPPEPIRLVADPLRVAQVITNLLTNAARYTPAGGHIVLEAGVGDGHAWIAVEDDGIGIPAENLESIFEMFAQGRARDGHGGGLGIGLALSRGIAQLHGGTLVATSAGSGCGSRFTLRLPLGQVNADAAPHDAPARAEEMPPLRILIADDNRDAAETLASVLRLTGHAVTVAFDGEGALREQARARAEVVILDIGMPGLSGYEVAQRMRAEANGGAPLLIALTGWGQARDKASAAGAGFDHHLTKPVDMRALNTILRSRALARKRGAGEAVGEG
jgi:CheY-like chemotaxis protein/nitrogen-specific signal transduction histidine kinase/putative methionine-R-sulfoxide reductase with GAF domain